MASFVNTRKELRGYFSQDVWKLCSRCGVEHIDKDETEGDKEDNPGGDNVGGDEEGDPGHGDEHGGGKVDGEDEGAERARKLHLETVHWVVAWKNSWKKLNIFICYIKKHS